MEVFNWIINCDYSCNAKQCIYQEGALFKLLIDIAMNSTAPF